MSQRIYVVTGEQQPRLVRASSQAQAIGYVVRNKYKAAVASQTDLIELLSQGVKVEEATEEEK